MGVSSSCNISATTFSSVLRHSFGNFESKQLDTNVLHTLKLCVGFPAKLEMALSYNVGA